GALETPRILLSSVSSTWPNGVANDSGMVGKNLMRHYIDLYALSLPCKLDSQTDPKELGLNDFYQTPGGGKFGTLQSFGWLPPPAVSAAYVLSHPLAAP